MNPVLKNIFAVITGIVLGSVVNMSIIAVGDLIISLPEGADNSTMEALKETMHLFQPKHFLFPFLAHAMGTFVGALLAAKIAASNKMVFALVIGGVFLAGGISMVFMIPSPLWFAILDLVGAYLTMGWLAGKLVTKAS